MHIRQWFKNKRPRGRISDSNAKPSAMGKEIDEAVRRHRGHAIAPGRCGSVHVQRVSAPLPAVWSLVRRFDRPQAYKRFVRNCHVISGDGGVGTLREVLLVSGLPASTSTERLDELDDERHVAGFSVVGGDHRLANYRSTTSVHVAGEGEAAVVVESYVVDVPPGSTKEETVAFVDTIVRCNLRSLAHEAQVMARSVASDV